MLRPTQFRVLAVLGAVAGALFFAPTPATADMSLAPSVSWVEQYDNSTPLGSWAAPMRLNPAFLSDSIDLIAWRITPPHDETFATTAFTDFEIAGIGGTGGWGLAGMDESQRIAVAAGTSTWDALSFMLHFNGDMPTVNGEVEIDVAVFSNGVNIANAHGDLIVNGSSAFSSPYFSFVGAGSWPVGLGDLPMSMSVPAPGALLLGAMGLGLIVRRFA